jgi:hypothetical protein
MCLIKLWAHEMKAGAKVFGIGKTDKEEAAEAAAENAAKIKEANEKAASSMEETVVEESNDYNHNEYNSLQRSLDIVPKDQVEMEEEEIVNLNQINLDVLHAMET